MTERRQRNGHTLALNGIMWHCLQCGHRFDALSDADAFWCGDECSHPDDEADDLDAYRGPFVVDVAQTSVYALSRLAHVHHTDGSCFKNRYGPKCDERAE